MGFRITTNMMLSSYRYNLMSANNKLSDSRDKVLTQRKFSSFSEDPAAATQSFRLRRALYQNNSHTASNQAVVQKFNSAWGALGAVVTDLSDKTARAAAVMGNNGTAGESRTALGKVLEETARSVVQTMNVAYGDHFIFAGNDGLNVPFSWEGGKLLYRGVDVNAGGVEMPTSAQPSWYPAGPIPDSADPAYDADWANYKVDQDNLKKLEAMAAEELNVDLGMGMEEDGSGKLINGSAFDSALSGIKILGYGVDADGDPKNLACIMQRLGEIFSRCDNESGAFTPPEDEEVANRLMGKLKDAQGNATSEYVEMDAKSTFLTTNASRLSEVKDAITEQILDLEQVELADAITSFSWDLYCYNAALKIGNQLLSQSLIDYMN